MAPSSRDEATTVSLARLTGMGTEFLSAILAGGGIGWLIDYWLGSRPTGLIIGLIAGIIVGGVTFIRHALAANKAASDAYARSHPHAARDDETDA
jgi:ATP synthase protein I